MARRLRRPEFDGVIDFDAALRDPTEPDRIRPDLTVDHLHPNGEGYRLMGEAIDLALFTGSTRRQP